MTDLTSVRHSHFTMKNTDSAARLSTAAMISTRCQSTRCPCGSIVPLAPDTFVGWADADGFAVAAEAAELALVNCRDAVHALSQTLAIELYTAAQAA